MTKLEEVARAICTAEYRGVICAQIPDAAARATFERGIKTQQDLEWKQYVPAARAAIQALREPSEAMISAGAAEAWHAEYDTSERAWQAMIDAILNEKP